MAARSNDALVALRVDGSTAWTSPTSREALAGGRSRVIALCAEGGLCAVDRVTGQRIWCRADFTPTRAIIIGAGLLVVNYVSPDHAVPGATEKSQHHSASS
ncbi:MAG: hypothetical protein WAW82_02655 [Candidatus Lutibacillus vidarii]|nr:hypothetical protein [Candidatus Lutibacillus vidarii]HON75053.1 hypothetical protein [Dermatophilaceae bacterium]